MINEMNFNTYKKVHKLPRKKGMDDPEFYTYYENDNEDACIIEQYVKEYNSKSNIKDNEFN